MAFSDFFNYRVFIVIIVAIVGILVTRYGMRTGSNYSNYILSPHQPPSWMFGLVWTILYIGYAVVWVYLTRNYSDTTLEALFIFNMILNVLWVILFFGAGMVELSKYVILALFALTIIQGVYVWTTVPTYRGSYVGVCTFYLFIYASWLAVASGLNLETMV
jgi:translocator protein